MAVTSEIPLVMVFSTAFLVYVHFPLKLRLLIPLASDPFDLIYETSTTFPSESAFPKIPSPKIISYCSSSISCM